MIQVEHESMETNASLLMKQMRDKLPKQVLATTAAKKRNEKSGKMPKGVETRAAAKLTSDDPSVKSFTLANLRKAKTKREVLFQLQENAAAIMSCFDRLDYNKEQQAMCVGFFLNEFQRYGIYASCDSLIFHQVGNCVS